MSNFPKLSHVFPRLYGWRILAPTGPTLTIRDTKTEGVDSAMDQPYQMGHHGQVDRWNQVAPLFCFISQNIIIGYTLGFERRVSVWIRSKFIAATLLTDLEKLSLSGSKLFAIHMHLLMQEFPGSLVRGSRTQAPKSLSGWRFQSIKKILVKLDHFTR